MLSTKSTSTEAVRAPAIDGDRHREPHMTVGVIGYYGYGNVGDEAILENLRHVLSPHRAVPLPVGLAQSSDTVSRLNAFDFLILGGGGLYRDAPPNPFGTFGDWEERLTTPIGVVGLGVTTLDPRFRTDTRRLIDRSVFFIVRDEESRRILGHSKVQVAPDLTFYRPLEVERKRVLGDDIVCGVNLRPAHGGIQEWVQAVRKLPGTKRALPFSTHPALGDRDVLLAVDPDCPTEFSPELFASIDVLVGTAFHSILFAIQTGTPVVAINYDPKVARIMEEVGLSRYMLEWNAWGQLPEYYDRVLADSESIRRRMAEYTARASAHVRETLRTPRRIIADTLQSQPTTRPKHTPTPRVSVIIDGEDDTSTKAVQRTLSSCLDQTYDDVEIVLLVGDEVRVSFAHLLEEHSTVRVVDFDAVGPDRLSLALHVATGTYVTWLSPGAWYADDAIALLVKKLEEHPDADAVHASFFRTVDGVIERKVRLHTAYAPHTAALFGPCFLVRRERVDRLWAHMRNSRDENVDGIDVVYVRCALFFQPATPSEQYLYRSLMAYSRGNFARGKQLFAEALRTRDGATDWRTADDTVELIATTARKATVATDPIEFVELVFRHLPENADSLRALKRRVKAHVIMTDFFATHSAKNGAELLRTAWRGLRNDPRWLRNRGVWAILWRALVTLVLPDKSIARKRPRRSGNTVE